MFHSLGDVTFTGEGLQILTYTRNLLPSSIEGSLACRTYCDKGHLFIMVFSEDRAFSSGAVTTCIRSDAVVLRTPNLPLAGRTLLPTVPPSRLQSLVNLW